jgi:hypothetical protein
MTSSSLFRLSALRVTLLLSFCLVASSCGTDPSDDDDSSVTDDDDSAPPGDDDDTSVTDDDDSNPPGDDDDSATVEGGTIEGNVSRSVDLTGDGLGGLLVTISDHSIVGGPPKIMAEATLADQDFSAPDATLTFTVHGIPPRPEPYQVEIFFDEDDSGGLGGPSTGDLTVSSPVPVTVPTEDSVSISIELDTVAP